MPDRVADASVLGAIAFGESRGEEAVSLLESADLYEPSLLAYELSSIARSKIREDPEQRDSILRGLELMLDWDFAWMNIDQLQVVDLALETGLSTYDASYLYVARTLGLPLVTFDRRLQAVASRSGT